ncbi:MAG: hypothetical protein WD802_02805 [Gemmatimonadaceae bacterium]
MTDPPADWLSRRTPPPPEELAAAIRGALKSRTDANKDPSPTELLEAAQALLEKVLKDECAQRESALDLLTADALVTYALEIANDAKALNNFPEQVLDRLAGRVK